MGISLRHGGARKYDVEVAELRWDAEQKRAQVLCLQRKVGFLEGQIGDLDTEVNQRDAALAEMQSQLMSRGQRMTAALFGSNERIALKNAINAWRDYALHEVREERLQDELRRMDRDLREKTERLQAHRMKITSLEDEMERLTAALKTEKEKFASAKEYQSKLEGNSAKAKEKAEWEKREELVRLERGAVNAAKQLGIRIPTTLLTQEQHLQQGAAGGGS